MHQNTLMNTNLVVMTQRRNNILVYICTVCFSSTTAPAVRVITVVIVSYFTWWVDRVCSRGTKKASQKNKPLLILGTDSV